MSPSSIYKPVRISQINGIDTIASSTEELAATVEELGSPLEQVLEVES